MTTLGSLLQSTPVVQPPPQPLDIDVLAFTLAFTLSPALVAAGADGATTLALMANLKAWTNQDDDAHEPCSLTACRTPLHPGPCKGWKHTLHLVSPGAYHQLEEERVRRANGRRLKRIADLKAQGRPIPRHLLDEIKPKPAPAHGVSAVPLHQVGQKADLAGGQAHHAGQAVSNAAGVQVKTAPLPLGPKQKKPSVSGRGPAFVITQPKVTDQYKLDKAAKITPQEWASLSDADKNTIRNEITAIKARGFGPQQKKSDELLAKLYAPNAAGSAPLGKQIAPGTPGTITTPKGNVHQVINPTPGKVSLGQAVKPIPAAPSAPPTPAHVQLARAVANRSAPKAVQSKTHVDAYGKLSKAEFDSLPADEQKTIRDDLANAQAKFLDPKKRQAATGLLNRFGSSNSAPAASPPISAPAAPAVPQAVTEALKAADLGTAHPDRVGALAGMSKAQFDALKPDEQRKVTDALHALHRGAPGTARNAAATAPLEKYTGLHPGVHRLRQAEADFRASKIDADQLHEEFLHAAVQAGHAGDDRLEKEAQRVAEDNPNLPTWLRARLVANPYSASGAAYRSIATAASKSPYDSAPRLSPGDIFDIFEASHADLANAHPIHQQAVKELRENVIGTGLAVGSPWSAATKNNVVDNLLHVSGNEPEIPRTRLDEFHTLPAGHQDLVRKVLQNRLDDQTDNHAKTATFITLRELKGDAPLTGAKRDAMLAAADRFPYHSSLATYRKLDPQEYASLPDYTRNAIRDHLNSLQTTVQLSGATRTWKIADDPLGVFPAALADHLAGTRVVYPDKARQDAADIAEYGRGIINPYDRTRAYGAVSHSQYQAFPQAAQAKIAADLDSIANDPANGLVVRYGARYTKDINLDPRSMNFNVHQVVAVASVDPRAGKGTTDQNVVAALTPLDKADFDKLDKTYREAIDERIKSLPGPQQQAFDAKFHSAAPAPTPSGYTPTVQATVPPHVQAAIDTIYGVHSSGKSHTMAHQLATYGALRGSDFGQLNAQEQTHLLGDLSFIATTAKGPSADKARKLIDRFTPPGTPAGHVPTPPIVPPANAVAGQTRYATPLRGTLVQAKDKGVGGDGWTSTPGGKQVWGKYGAAGLLLMHQDPATGERRYLMVQRGPAISDPGKWQFPGGAIDSKETPHQGGTREVIEELGFKADALKDAEVHGEHVNSIPGSTWAYTSIAAQVPAMLKPDLSTHHARAETSDAQWMTEAQIRKLDTDGKLLAPLAGGKLEQNVLSLFPAAGGAKLGQLARPGPVTKRQGRLATPAGGRQAPASFNAWPHPHKQSTGKNLIPDKAAFDAQRQKIKQDRKLYDGKTADGRLAAIGAQQGFDDTPTVVDKKEIDRLLATGDYIEAWRGVSGAGGGWSARSRGGSNGKTAAQINEEMRSGPAYYGKGIFGNGYYLATQRRVATQYSDGTSGSVVRMLIPKTAVTEKYDKVAKESHANPQQSKAKGASYYETSTFYDPGRYAAAKGLDGIEIESHHMSPGGGAAHVAAKGKPAFNWLNRSVLIIQKEPG